MKPIIIPGMAEESARVEAIRREVFTAELQAYGFRPEIIALLITFDYEHVDVYEHDQHFFRLRHNINLPVVITLAADAGTRDLHDAFHQAGRDSFRDVLAPAWHTLNSWLSKPSFVNKHRTEH